VARRPPSEHPDHVANDLALSLRDEKTIRVHRVQAVEQAQWVGVLEALVLYVQNRLHIIRLYVPYPHEQLDSHRVASTMF